MIVKFELQPNIQVLKAYQNSLDEIRKKKKNWKNFQNFAFFAKIRDFKSNYNCEFLIFLIHSRCKNHLWYSKNSIPKKNLRCARLCARSVRFKKWKIMIFIVFELVFGRIPNVVWRVARAEVCARQKFFRYEFFRKNRYVLHQKRMQNLWNWLRNNKNRRLCQNHRVLTYPLATLAIYQTGKKRLAS